MKSLLAGVFGLESVVDSGSLRFIVIDGSTVQEPGARETTYRLHIAIDLINLSVRQVEVTSDKVAESLDHYTLESGDVVLVDRGYNSPKSLVPFLDKGGEIVLRYNAHGMKLFEQDEVGRMVKIDWHSRVQTLNGRAGSIEAYLCHGNKRIPVVVHAVPLPADKAIEARRRAHRRSKNISGKASKKTLYLSGWVLVLSSLPPSLLSTETASALYRVRWQVELLIKRMKSLLDIDKLRARKESELSQLYLHGKLLYVAVAENIVQSRFAPMKRKMDAPREITDWRPLRSIADEFKAIIKACFPRRDQFIADGLKSMTERPRKRQLQALPEEITDLIESCRKMGLSHV